MHAHRKTARIAFGLLILVAWQVQAEQPTPGAVAGFNAYVAAANARIARQDGSTQTFLPLDSGSRARVRRGEILVERLAPPHGGELPGGLVHDWRATAFVPGATAEDLARLLRDYSRYPSVFSPQVVRAQVLAQRGDGVEVALRLRQRHVLTVVLDTDYDVSFSRLDWRHVASFSRSTRIAEISAPGTAAERPLTPAEDHGFLWRLDTWWSGEQADGGLYVQVESVSLTRRIPAGLAWLIGPYLESVPRESLEFTIRSVCRVLHP